MMRFAIGLTDDFDGRWFGTAHDTAGAAATPRSRLHELDPGDRGPGRSMIVPTVLTPGRVSLDRWLAAGWWFEFSRGGDLPDDWPTGATETRCGNCGATATSMCSMACPDRLLTSVGKPGLAVQVPCELHEGGVGADGGVAGPQCVDGLVTVAWATNEFGPLRVVDYRYRLRRSKPNQFKLSDGSYHDASVDVEPICLPGRWARGGRIEAIAEVAASGSYAQRQRG